MPGDRYQLYAEPEGGPRSYLMSDNDLEFATFQAERIADLSPLGTTVVLYDGDTPLFAVHQSTTQPSIWEREHA